MRRVGCSSRERTEGGTRRYSADDLDRLRRIGDLLDAGLNLAGIAMVMDLQDENTDLHDENTQLRADERNSEWLPTTPIKPARSRPGIDPGEQIPEADLLEQQTPLDPTLIDDPPALAEVVDRAASADPSTRPTAGEQQLPVPSADDDYPYDDPGDGFEAE